MKTLLALTMLLGTGGVALAREYDTMAASLFERMRGGLSPQELRADLQEGRSKDMRRRRLIILLSLLGILDAAPIAMFQAGLLRRLPDPPLRAFQSTKVNSSDTSYTWGFPDGAGLVATFALNVPIAAFGGAARAGALPALPLLQAAKSGVEAVASAWFFYQMPAKEKAWCWMCIIAALLKWTIAALAMPEAWRALRGG